MSKDIIDVDITDTERNDLLTALRLWLPHLREASKKDIVDLIEKLDVAGSKEYNE